MSDDAGRPAAESSSTEPAEPASSAGRAGKSEPGLSAEQLGKRARWGVVALVVRTVLMQVTVLGGTIALARLLEPADFGVFAIVQFALAFIAYFGDAGLGAALVQKKLQPGQRELSSVFWVQLALALAVLVVVSAGADAIRFIWTDLPPSAGWLLRALSLALLLTSLRAIPSILLERELLFGRLGVIDVVNQAGFYLGAIPLALAGTGTWSLVGGVLVQSVLACGLSYALRPWRPSLELDRGAIRSMVRFGLPFQAKNLIGFVNGAVTPLYGGAVLGETRLGYINWAQSTAYFPLKLVEIMSRVTFPLFSRFQHDRALLSGALARSVHVCALGTFFFVAVIFGIGEPLVRLVYTDKWLPSLPLLYIFAGAISLGFLAPLVASALDALGRPTVFLKLSIGWTLLAWIGVLVTTPRWGMVGYVAGYSVHVVVGNVLVLFVLRRLIPETRIARRLLVPFLAAVAVAVVGRLWLTPHLDSVLLLVLALVGSALGFLGIVLGIDGRQVRDALALVKK